MKTIVSMLAGAAMLYRGAKIYGIRSFADLKDFIAMELRSLVSQVKKEVDTN